MNKQDAETMKETILVVGRVLLWVLEGEPTTELLFKELHASNIVFGIDEEGITPQ